MGAGPTRSSNGRAWTWQTTATSSAAHAGPATGPPRRGPAEKAVMEIISTRYYVPTTVTSVDFTSNPGSDRCLRPVVDTIQVTVAFSEDVTVGYVGSKKHAAEVDLEMGGQTRTAHYARTEGNKVKSSNTRWSPGDEETFALLLRPNSLRLDLKDKPSGKELETAAGSGTPRVGTPCWTTMGSAAPPTGWTRSAPSSPAPRSPPTARRWRSPSTRASSLRPS